MSKFYDFEAEDVMCNMHKMEEYQEQGFEILDFPCNQFGNQAPGTNEEIVSFCDAKFGIIWILSTLSGRSRKEKKGTRG